MAEKLGIYKCGICGNVAEIVHAGAGDMSCCGAPMDLLKETVLMQLRKACTRG